MNATRNLVLSFGAALLLASLVYFLVNAKLERLGREIADLKHADAVMKADDQLARSMLSDHAHPRLENSLTGCRQTDEYEGLTAQKTGEDRCTALFFLHPSEGGTCPKDFDIVVNNERVEVRDAPLTLKGELLVSKDFPCHSTRVVGVIQIGPPGFGR